MTVLRTLAAAAVIAAALYAGEAAAQSNGQQIRAKNAAAQQGAKRSFELDLSKLSSGKHPQAQRTAGKVQGEWKKNHRTRNVKKTQGKKSMTRDQKNFGALNR